MRGVSQRALGAMLGLTKKNGSVRINRYEQQSSKADMETAFRLADAMQIPAAFLFANDDRLAKIILFFSELTEEEKEEFMRQSKQWLARKAK